MTCNNCGTEVGTSRFCTNCGMKMPEIIQWNDLQEFYKEHASGKTKMWVTWYLIMNFVAAVINVLGLIGGNVILLVDIAIRLGIGFIILRSKNWKAALCGSIYGAILFLICVIMYQETSGLLYVVVGGIVASKLHKLDVKYEEYKKTRTIPEKEI